MQRWNIVDNISLGRTQQLLKLCHQVTGREPVTEDPCFWFRNGFHFLNNTQDNQLLGIDGYDNYQAPMDRDMGTPLFRRRMWVGGTITFHTQPNSIHDIINCEENILGIRRMGELTFVTINREFSNHKQPLISEVRKMMYTQKYFESIERPQDNWHPNNDLTFLLSYTAIRRYSFLTNNLHRIHIDPDYARGYEGLPNVIVHGPFMVTLMLYLLSNFGVTTNSFNYRNFEPCFANDSILFVHNGETRKVSLVNPVTGRKYIEGIYS